MKIVATTLVAFATLVTSTIAFATPPPPAPYRPRPGVLSSFAGYDAPARRSISSLDLGLSISGSSPVAVAPGNTLSYLNIGSSFGNRYVYLEARSQFIPALVDGLIGLALINFNVAQSDDFPPFAQIFNRGLDGGVWEFLNLMGEYVVSTDADSLWGLGLQAHITLLDEIDGANSGIVVGAAPALTYAHITPTWDWTSHLYGGPETGSATGGYVALGTEYRRALAAGFGIYGRYVFTLHALNTRVYPAGQLEFGFAFGNWE